MNARHVMVGLLVSLSAGTRAEVELLDVADGGGGRATSASYAQVAGVTGMGTVSESAVYQNRGGWVGQLAEVSSLSLTGTPLPAAEESTVELWAVAGLDDGSFTVVGGSEVSWEVVSGPLSGVDSDGVAGTGSVWAETPATVRGRYFEAMGSLTWTVLDSQPDNFGSYAGDGLPDEWQVGFFGFDSLDAAPGADPDGNGQDNWFEYLAGTVPTNSASGFRLEIAPVAGEPQQMALRFSPVRADRVYVVEFRTDLTQGGYAPLESVEVADEGEWRVVTDLEAVEAAKFYRVKIALP